MSNIWNDKKVEKMKSLLASGLSTSEIGKKLGVSKNAVIGKIHRLGLDKLGAKAKEIKKSNTKPNKKESNLFSFAISKQKETIKDDKNIKQEKDTKEYIKTEQNTTNSIEQKIEIDAVSPSKHKGKKYKLQDLKIDMCRWAYGEPNSPNFFFCGEKTYKNKPYCEKHCSIAYVTKKTSE